MIVHGIVQSAELVEQDEDSGRIEVLIKAQGVGAGQPRKFFIPYETLLVDDSLDVDLIQGRAFEAEITSDPTERWIAVSIRFAGRMLKPKDYE